ncbi:hypothetical protein TYRP_006180 [Tyrophagus putrescentiae]|nr:hypothetical protein TYRP_006180 [Tyrophagus putrescentiae]
MPSSAVHGTRRRGLAPLGHCKLPLPRASRAKRAGPEAAEVYSGQAMSATAVSGCVRTANSNSDHHCSDLINRAKEDALAFLMKKGQEELKYTLNIA